MSQIVNQVRLDANWSAISAELDAPKASMAERLLGRLRVPGHIARLVVATPALRRAWYLAIGIAVLIGLGSARPDNPASVFVLLAIAPALPVLGVAMAYGRSADPMYEAQVATPMPGLRLVAIRTVTVLVVAILAVGVPALLASTTRSMAFAWLLPALALTSASLALMTWFPPRRATAIVAVIWFVGVVVARRVGPDELAAFGAFGQLGAAMVTAIGVAVIGARRSSFDRMEHAS